MQVGHMAGVQQIKAAIREDDTLPAPPPLSPPGHEVRQVVALVVQAFHGRRQTTEGLATITVTDHNRAASS
jgi:hypothetical protein